MKSEFFVMPGLLDGSVHQLGTNSMNPQVHIEALGLQPEAMKANNTESKNKKPLSYFKLNATNAIKIKI